MQSADSQRLFVVVALFEPVAVGTTFGRWEWPAHITLASNFGVDVTRARVENAVSEACVETGPLFLRFAGPAEFGPDRDIPVQLIDSAQILALHERLADALEAMPGFAPSDPLFWRRGYRPHMTHVPGTPSVEGERSRVAHVAIAELSGTTATIVTAITLAIDTDADTAHTLLGEP